MKRIAYKREESGKIREEEEGMKIQLRFFYLNLKEKGLRHRRLKKCLFIHFSNLEFKTYFLTVFFNQKSLDSRVLV